MSRRYVYRRLTPEQFRAGLEAAGLKPLDFARCTGSDPRRVERWLDGTQADPPFWIGGFLGALTIPDARRLVLQYVAQNVSSVGPGEPAGSGHDAE